MAATTVNKGIAIGSVFGGDAKRVKERGIDAGVLKGAKRTRETV